jgi:hypothetical protein
MTTTNTVTIGTITTPVISYQGQRVCTTQQLAQLYGATPEHIHDNHRKNRDRFEEGKHFVKLEGEVLRQFKDNQPEISRLVAKRAAHLILWTERGAARHAKMLETDAAWDVFEQLEDAYFTPAPRHRAQSRAHIADGHERSNKHDRLPLYHFAIDTVVNHHVNFSKVYALLNLYAGSRRFKDMTKEQAAELADFCDRFAVGQDTRNDWQRIVNNQARLHGLPVQVDMVQKLLLS